MIGGLLVVTSFLFLSQRYCWFAFNRHKGWTVLIALAGVALILLATGVRLALSAFFRSRFQFSVRFLLALTAAVTLPLGWLAAEFQAAREQARLVKLLNESLHYDWEEPWLMRLGNPTIARGPKGRSGCRRSCRMTSSRTLTTSIWSPGPLDQLRKLPALRSVTVQYPHPDSTNEYQVPDDDLGWLDGLASLEYLKLDTCKTTSDAEFAHLEGLTRLKALDLGELNILDDGLAHLAGLVQLDTLLLRETQVTDAGLVHLAGLTKLTILDLEKTRVGDAGIAHLGNLTCLENLALSGTHVTDAGLRGLSQLPALSCVFLDDTAVTDDGLSISSTPPR